MLLAVHTCAAKLHNYALCLDGGNCTTGDVRLSVSNGFSHTRTEGRVQVCYNNEWGSVCDDYWSNINTGVVCAELGFNQHGI